MEQYPPPYPAVTCDIDAFPTQAMFFVAMSVSLSSAAIV